MKKNELKEIVLHILEFIQENIQTDKELSVHEAIEYLQHSNTIFDKIEDKDYRNLTLIETLENLKKKYEEIAKESIDSYQKTNENFEKIAKKHQEHLEQFSTTQIDLDGIQEKFSEIQNHMVNEIQKANEEIQRLNQKVRTLEEETNIDPLTKAYNRRALERYLQKVCQKKTLKHELHLLILDIDDFKTINDKYGHIAGDKILIFTAHILRHMLRDGDRVFRYGGEEFVVVLNRIETKQCINIAQRILKQISSNNLIYKGDTMKVTVSVGATRYSAGDTPETLIARADHALYEAKKSGKNKLIVRETK